MSKIKLYPLYFSCYTTKTNVMWFLKVNSVIKLDVLHICSHFLFFLFFFPRNDPGGFFQPQDTFLKTKNQQDENGEH